MDEKIYLPEEVPDDLFTDSRLRKMGLVATAEHIAYVSYPEQNNIFKLYDIANTRKRKQQKKTSLRSKNSAIENILEERKNEMKVRKSQLK